MTLRSCSAMVRRLSTAAVVTALLAMGAAPAMAASPDTTKPPSFSQKAVAKAVAASATPATASAKSTPKQATASSSFFKTRTGLLVIAVMAVGTGYAMYSAKEDRIRGINR